MKPLIVVGKKNNRSWHSEHHFGTNWKLNIKKKKKKGCINSKKFDVWIENKIIS